jgi:hypothetical protein
MLSCILFSANSLIIIMLFVISAFYCRLSVQLANWFSVNDVSHGLIAGSQITLTLQDRVDIPGREFYFHSFAELHLNLTLWCSNNFLWDTLKANDHRPMNTCTSSDVSKIHYKIYM